MSSDWIVDFVILNGNRIDWIETSVSPASLAVSENACASFLV